MRRNIHRSDRGSQAISIGLRAYGVDVEPIGRPVDLLCGFRGANYLLEVKAPDARKRRDQPKQDLFLRTWKGQVAKVTNLDEALRAVGVVHLTDMLAGNSLKIAQTSENV